MPDFGSYFLLPAGGCKIATLLSPKCRRHRRRFRKRLDSNSASAATVSGGSGSLSAGFLGSTKSAAAADFSGVVGLAAASIPGGNSVRKCVDFLRSWLTLPGYRSCSSLGFSSTTFSSLFLCLLGFLQPSCGFERFLWWHSSHKGRYKSIISGLVSMTDVFKILQRLIPLGLCLLIFAVLLIHRRRWRSNLF